MNLQLVRGCKVGKGMFASFIELEVKFLCHALEPIFVPMLNNATCEKRYGKECHMRCARFIDGIVAGSRISWRVPGKTM